MNNSWPNMPTALMAFLLMTAIAPDSSAQPADGLTKEYALVDPNRPVICLKPGRVRKLGGRMIYQERRRPEKSIASECEIRGGEYTLYDRTNSETALQLWLDLAEQGDAQAQVNVGEIYEKGWTGEPDHESAFLWYSRAAEKGHHQAERRLAFLYENGLGVSTDMQKALNLWRSAMQLDEELIPASAVELARQEDKHKIDRLLNQLEDQNLATARLQNALQRKEVALNENKLKLLSSEAEITVLATSIQSNRTDSGNADKLAKMVGELEDREVDIQSLRDTVEILKVEVDSRSAQLVSSIKRAELKGRELNRAHSRIEEQAQQAAKLADELDAKNTQVAVLEDSGERQTLRENLLKAKRQSLRLENDLKKAREAIVKAEADAATLEGKLATIAHGETAKVKSLQEKLKGQKDAITQLDASQNSIQSEWKNTIAERDSLRNRLQSQAENRDLLEIELESTRSRLNSATADVRKLDSALQQAEFEKRKLYGSVDRLEEDLAINQSRTSTDLQDIKHELAQARSQLAGISSNSGTLQQQRNRASIEEDFIRDQQQNQILALRGVSRKAEILPPPRAGKAGPYHAVIIANHDYSFLPNLGTPRFDAVRLKRLLEDKYGFNVEVQTNLNREEMFKTLNRVRNFTKKDFVLVYYAGHGKMDDFGDGYWLPTDYSEDDPLSQAVSNSDITQTLSQSPAKHLLLIADSCYSGALLRRGNPIASIAVPSLMKFWLNNKSRTVLTSGGLQPVLDSGPDNNSVFASAMLSVLSSSKGAFNGEMLHAAMHDKVVEEAARLGYMDQKPQFAAIDDAGHENGQFVFTPKK